MSVRASWWSACSGVGDAEPEAAVDREDIARGPFCPHEVLVRLRNLLDRPDTPERVRRTEADEALVGGVGIAEPGALVDLGEHRARADAPDPDAHRAELCRKDPGEGLERTLRRCIRRRTGERTLGVHRPDEHHTALGLLQVGLRETGEHHAGDNVRVEDVEQLLLVAELEELTANPTGRAKGVVLEANLDIGRGPVATVLVDKGVLKVGDPIVAGAAWGRVRALIDDKGQQVKSAGPSTPVQVLGLQSVPNAGDEFRSSETEKTARTVAEAREQRQRLKNQRGDARVQRGVKLEDIFSQIQAGEVATLNLVIKADVQGSLEAVTESLRRLERDDVKLAFVHRAVGAISESDINIAAISNATLIDRKSTRLNSSHT